MKRKRKKEIGEKLKMEKSGRKGRRQFERNEGTKKEKWGKEEKIGEERW